MKLLMLRHEHDTEVVSQRRLGCRMGVSSPLSELDARGCSAARISSARSVQRDTLRGYCQMLWMRAVQAASFFSTPSTNTAPSTTAIKRSDPLKQFHRL